MLYVERLHVKLQGVNKECKAMQIERLAVNRFEAARMLSISLRTLDALLAQGELRGRRVGRRVVFPIEELQRFLRKDHALAERSPQADSQSNS
jgi:excisionase family DNA binding protein